MAKNLIGDVVDGRIVIFQDSVVAGIGDVQSAQAVERKATCQVSSIAGQNSTCAKVSNLAQAQQGNETSKVTDFTVCVTDSGVLARFAGTTTDGTKANIELTGYSGSVDDGLLQPPAGAKITDVGQLDVPSPAAT